MKTKFHFHDNTCPQPPSIRAFAREQLKPLTKKNPHIASITFKFNKLSRSRNHDIYKVSATATGRGLSKTFTARSVTVRAALQSLRLKCEATPRVPLRASNYIRQFSIPS